MAEWEKGGEVLSMCVAGVCVCVCVYAYAYNVRICRRARARACVCVLCVHSTQHTLRLWQTDSKPRNPHTPLPRLIVHEIRTFGLQNAPCTPPHPLLRHPPPWEIEFYGSSVWDNCSKGLDRWEEIPCLIEGVLDGFTRKPNKQSAHSG